MEPYLVFISSTMNRSTEDLIAEREAARHSQNVSEIQIECEPDPLLVGDTPMSARNLTRRGS